MRTVALAAEAIRGGVHGAGEPAFESSAGRCSHCKAVWLVTEGRLRMAGEDDGTIGEAAGKRRGRMMAWLIAVAMLAGLGGCAQSAPAPGSSAGQTPGSFNLHINGRLTSAFGAATP